MNSGVRFLMCGVLILLLATGCATIQYVPLPDQSQRIENAEQSRIYLVRKRSDQGEFWRENIEDNGQRVGAIREMGYLCWEREPGRTTITPSLLGGSGGSVDLYVRKGEVYYLVFCTQGNYIWTISESVGQAYLEARKPPTVTLPR